MSFSMVSNSGNLIFAAIPLPIQSVDEVKSHLCYIIKMAPSLKWHHVKWIIIELILVRNTNLALAFQ